MHNGAGKGSYLFTYPTKYSDESLLLYECLLDNTVFLIYTSSILTGPLFLWKPFLLIQS